MQSWAAAFVLPLTVAKFRCAVYVAQVIKELGTAVDILAISQGVDQIKSQIKLVISLAESAAKRPVATGRLTTLSPG